eukprot:755240-Hanusia_phi.AAC.4
MEKTHSLTFAVFGGQIGEEDAVFDARLSLANVGQTLFLVPKFLRPASPASPAAFAHAHSVAALFLYQGIFDFCVAVPISHPHWNQVIGIMTFYHLDRRQSTDIRQETEASAPPKALGKRFRHFWRKYLRKFKGQVMWIGCVTDDGKGSRRERTTSVRCKHDMVEKKADPRLIEEEGR